MRRSAYILLPLAALLAVLPLWRTGCSCGHDFTFHLQSWLDAAQQMRHGTLYPHWAFSPAWNAGEPRFIFYPPLSWMLGALLTMVFPITIAPVVYTFVALMAAGFAMYRLANHFVAPEAALLAAALYLANPYMLFNAFERTAYAELLAAAWIPLLLLAVLRKRTSVAGIAVPIALLWLTNAPAAVMGCYTFALLAGIRVVQALRKREQPLQLAGTFVAGAVLGLALPALYLLPAAYERRYVQIAMAVIPGMRVEDNFLFGHTSDIPHDVVLHTASLLAVGLLVVTAIVLVILVLRFRRQIASRGMRASGMRDEDFVESPLPGLSILTLLIAFLLIPVSGFVWHLLPDLAFLQFPWRLLMVLSAVLGLAVALLLGRFNVSSSTKSIDRASGPPASELGIRGASPHAGIARASGPENQNGPGSHEGPRSHEGPGSHEGPIKRNSGYKAIGLLAPVCAVLLALVSIHVFRQPCEADETPTALQQNFQTHHGVIPTDEYTPVTADNDFIRPNDPAYWLADDPKAFAPNTTPNPGVTDSNFDGDFPPEQTLSSQTPLHFQVHAERPGYLILNLRAYPNWNVTDASETGMEVFHPNAVPRNDGLLAVPIPSGNNTIDIHWRSTRDEKFGTALSACALAVLVLTWRRSRKIV